MTEAGRLEQPPQGGLGRLVLGTAVFMMFIPPPMLALPLAALLAVTPGWSRAEFFTAVLAAGASFAWLLHPGLLPDQLVRAALVLTTTGFVAATVRTGASFTHRALFALAVAALVIGSLFVAFGWPWDELTWWVRSRTSYATRLAVSGVRAVAAGSDSATLGLELDRWVTTSAELASRYFPALIAIELMLGLALATKLYHRISPTPRGEPVGRLRDFRFSEHLGWAAAIPLIIVLLPRLAALKAVASNLLLVTGALYALRGIAVAVAGAILAGSGAFAAVAGIAVAFLLLPVVLGSAVLLGVIDAGLDLRRRWSKPPTSGQPWT